ncbi:MAG: ATP-binding protein [Lentisphaeria bacterium]|jgi:signal transduction histidine kinase|nr:ATP-binding protein [Lentisphaeria bacterium]
MSPTVANTWQRRVQNVRLRTKIIVPMIVLTILPTVTIGYFAISRMRQTLHENAIQAIKFDTVSKARAVERFFDSVQQDLDFLSQLSELRGMIAAKHLGIPSQVTAMRLPLEEKFLVFSQGRDAYYQIRYLDLLGQEVVRINIIDGGAEIVPTAQLQNKQDRYYVLTGLVLNPGETYISPMDLNIEDGKVERPERGVVRFVTAVAGQDGQGAGLLVLNVYSDYLLTLIGPLAPDAEAWLLDHEGQYLGYIGDRNRNTEEYGLAAQRRIADDYSPAQTAEIMHVDDRSIAVETKTAFISSYPILLAHTPTQPARRFTLMVSRPRGPVETPIQRLTAVSSAALFVVMVVAGVLGVMITRYLTRPILRLREATRAIAAGDLDRVDVSTNDEIEELADDFNAMAEQLREAHTRLSAWNVRLEKEVQSKTEDLQRLQGGLARADKLASIGQMTAAVMHEIGNPLAAIKASIQVAEEDDTICEECREVMRDITAQVDRLASFLHSFSRLSRLREPVFEDVDIGEIAQGVVNLVTPDLRRRNVSLSLKDEGTSFPLTGDVHQLQQLLINLILNAGEASPADSKVVVRIYARPPGTSLTEPRTCVEVTDQGTGIEPAVAELIWDPFFTTKPEGTGLGLAICRKIVSDHGGDIALSNHSNGGTTVTVTFGALQQEVILNADSCGSGLATARPDHDTI